MKILSWNINGLKSILQKKNLYDLINTENPDIFCLSEIKLNSINNRVFGYFIKI